MKTFIKFSSAEQKDSTTEVELEQDLNLVAVQFAANTKGMGRLSVAEQTHLNAQGNRFEIPRQHFTIFEVKQDSESPDVRQTRAQSALSANENVTRSLPIYKYNNTRLIAPEQLIIGFESGTGKKKINALFKKYNLKKVSQISDTEYVVSLTEQAADSITETNKIVEEDIVNYAHQTLSSLDHT